MTSKCLLLFGMHHVCMAIVICTFSPWFDVRFETLEITVRSFMSWLGNSCKLQCSVIVRQSIVLNELARLDFPRVCCPLFARLINHCSNLAIRASETSRGCRRNCSRWTKEITTKEERAIIMIWLESLSREMHILALSCYVDCQKWSIHI